MKAKNSKEKQRKAKKNMEINDEDMVFFALSSSADWYLAENVLFYFARTVSESK